MMQSISQGPAVNRKALERKAIQLTIWANFIMGLLGVGFSLYTDSQAILLDGLFSFANFLISLITLRVAKLVAEPGDEHYNFGYAIFEPMLNLAKGLIIASLCLYALISSIEAVLSGGRAIEIGIAVVYASIVSAGCFMLAIILPKLAKKSASSIVAVDAKNWIIDGTISAVVLLSFCLVFLLQQSSYTHWLPYVDPVMVIVLVIITISIPVKIVKDNWNQIIGKAPVDEIEQADALIKAIIAHEPSLSYHLRSGRFGQLLYIQLYILADKNTLLSLEQQDRMRLELYEALSNEFPTLATDIIFTTQNIWVERSIRAV